MVLVLPGWVQDELSGLCWARVEAFLHVFCFYVLVCTLAGSWSSLWASVKMYLFLIRSVQRPTLTCLCLTFDLCSNLSYCSGKKSVTLHRLKPRSFPSTSFILPSFLLYLPPPDMTSRGRCLDESLGSCLISLLITCRLALQSGIKRCLMQLP